MSSIASDRYLQGASTVDYLAGNWNVVRLISDHRTGAAGSFRGTASFQPHAAGARSTVPPNGRVLAYHEHGDLRLGSHHGPATRSLLYQGLADGSADVRFADGRPFYRLDLRSGSWSARHPCRADQYEVTASWLGPDRFTETWRVRGPAKDYELTTTYTRTAPGRCEPDGGEPARDDTSEPR